MLHYTSQKFSLSRLNGLITSKPLFILNFLEIYKFQELRKHNKQLILGYNKKTTHSDDTEQVVFTQT